MYVAPAGARYPIFKTLTSQPSVFYFHFNDAKISRTLSSISYRVQYFTRTLRQSTTILSIVYNAGINGHILYRSKQTE